MATTCVHIVRKPDVSEALRAITEPLITAYAQRIGADVNLIGTMRAFPDYPQTYERMQIYAAGRGYQRNICIDTDILIGPSLMDATATVPRDAVGLIMNYSAAQSFPIDNRFFARDGRDLVPVESCIVTADGTHDLWEPLRGGSMANMALVFNELQIAEYTLALNLAKYGLKCGGIFPSGCQIARIRGDAKTGIKDVDAAQALLSDWGSV
jgi:hypothetical protein